MEGYDQKTIKAAAITLAGRGAPFVFDASSPLALIEEGGSDRLFFRLGEGEQTAVVLYQPGGEREIGAYVDIGGFLFRNGIGVPEIYAHDTARGIILMEDLGERHLEHALEGASDAEAEELYRGALEILVELETAVTVSMRREGLLAERRFDRDVLLGETDYFLREFIEGFCPVPIPSGWDGERRHLAETLAREESVFMHRDFQSRNIMVKSGRLRIIDFQTAHRGPGLYDAASLLKDAYHPVPAAARRRLLEGFHAKLQARGARENEPFSAFHETFTSAGIQRNLQALAAFAKLGLRKRKRKFLDAIPNGLDLLEEGARDSGRFPALEIMIGAIRARMDAGGTRGV